MLLREDKSWLKYRAYTESAPVLLHGPEKCGFCGVTYISLYPLKFCLDHEGLEEV